MTAVTQLMSIVIYVGGALADILVGHKDEITAVAITSEGMRAVSTSKDNSMKMWDLRTGKVTKTINGVGKNVLQVCLHCINYLKWCKNC